MDLCMLQTIVGIAQIVTALVLLATFLIGFRQLRAMNKANQAQTHFKIFDILCRDEIVKARRIVMTRLFKRGEKQYLRDWTEEEKEAAETVCRTYDQAGLYVRLEMIPSKDFVRDWRDSITKCHEAVKPLLEVYRSDRGDDFWENFERLAEKAQKLREK